MGLFDVKYNFNELIRSTSAGIEISSFVQIKNAITERFKEIYGNDIDVSSETADGQYIMMLSLMLYNGYSSFLYLNQMSDPATATGKWLDIIAGFSNVFRKNASPSSAYVYVKYIGSGTNYTSNFGTNVQTIQFVDTNGKIWIWTEGKKVDGFATKFNPNETEPLLLKVFCEENGEINALANPDVLDPNFDTANLNKDNKGDICKTIDESVFPFEVWQASNAELGNLEESDQSFRIRRMQEIGNGGITVTNGLIGSLLEILGVREAKIYENVSNISGLIANDGTTIDYHNVYLCLRYKENVIDTTIDEEIANVIHNKLTLGIVTTNHTTDTTGVSKVSTIQVYGSLDYNIYWKKCKPITPSMTLTFTRNKLNYPDDDSYFEEFIKNAIKTYAKNLTIYDNFVLTNLLSYLNGVDVYKNNQPNYLFTKGQFDGNVEDDQVYKNKDTYYDYDNANFDFDYNSDDTSSYVTTTITITPSNE